MNPIQMSLSVSLSADNKCCTAVCVSWTDTNKESLSVSNGFRVVTKRNAFGLAHISRGVGAILGVMHVDSDRVKTGGCNNYKKILLITIQTLGIKQ